jgi:hypothetical protein
MLIIRSARLLLAQQAGGSRIVSMVISLNRGSIQQANNLAFGA